MKVSLFSTCAVLLLVASVGQSAGQDRYNMWKRGPRPKSVDCNSDVKLYLYTKGNSSPEKLKAGDSSTSPHWNASNPTRIVVHGWTANYLVMHGFATEYLSTDKDYNVVLVDYSGPASSDYASAILSSREVARCVVTVINDLKDNRGLQFEDLYLIGHSLGGQMVGVIGYLLGGQAEQVVGLDPAGPSFYLESLENRLDRTDGKLVQVIHTNGGTLGYLNACGDVDFFVNGGSKQAGCLAITDITGFCSHLRVLYYYIESIHSDQFVATQCGSDSSYNSRLCVGNPKDVAGEHVTGKVHGNFYVNTNTKSPFALGDVGLLRG